MQDLRAQAVRGGGVWLAGGMRPLDGRLVKLYRQEFKRVVQETFGNLADEQKLWILRILARAIDLAVIFLVAVVFNSWLGPLLAFAYSLLADALHVGPFAHQSVGKFVCGLQVKRFKDPAVLTEEFWPMWQVSCVRNLPMGVATFFGLIPVWGWLILAMTGLPLALVETFKIMTDPRGARLGDWLANSQVIFKGFPL